MVVEQIHRYPRWITWALDLLSFLAVGAALLLFSRDLLSLLWRSYGIDTTLLSRVPYLPEIVQVITQGAPLPRREVIGDAGLLNFVFALSQLLPSLGWLALALLLAVLFRNSLPTIRTSPRGMLVEFGGDWLPIPWEMLRAIKVTEDLAAERFVLLAETERKQLTVWHRFYSLLYRFSFRRSFLIISAISDFQSLIKTLLSETDRVARVLDNVKPAKLQEEASSPLFRLLLSPGSFFSRRSKAEVAAAPAQVMMGGTGREVLRGAYPRRISVLFVWGAGLLALVLLVRYATYWLKFLALTFPALQNQPVFDRLELRQLPAPWWLLVAAHLLLVLMIWLLAGLRNLLPDIETRGDGLAVRNFGRWIVVPWSSISAIKVTELSEESRIVLIQAAGLPASSRLSSLIYEGSLAPGVLVTSAITNFEQVLQRVVLEVSRFQSERGGPADKPILQSDARSNLLLLSFRAGPTIDALIAEVRDDDTTKLIDTRRMLRAAGTMAWLALPPALLLLFERSIQQGILLNGSIIGGMIVLFLLGLLEWPLTALALQMLDDMTGGGEEGYRGFYLYPVIQLPRLLPLFGALLMVLLGVPFLPVLLWLGAIIWSFLLAAGMAEGLYDWRGGQLFAGGLIPVVFQLLILLAYLVVNR
ncbi:MAG TPA: hypothetical protein VFU22_15285 [Roseiflexaceae bacterium]|nr:hypothetical protein [Roseiflexaceae bacterium]